MKKIIAILATAVALSGASLAPARAGLIGMPINLKAAIEHRNAQVLSVPLAVDDAFVVSVLI